MRDAEGKLRIRMLHADLIVTNANLITLDPQRSRARAMAIREGKIAAVGEDRDISALAGERTQRIDLAGKTITPGFCDSHVHMLWYGSQLLRQADLFGSADVNDVLDRLS